MAASPPIGSDALLALLILVTALLPLTIGADTERSLPEQTTLAVVVLILACGCLVLRRQAPWPVLAATSLLGLVAVADTTGPTPAYLPACVALYTVATRTTTANAVSVGVVTALLPLLLVLSAGGTGLVDALVFGMTAWSGLATMSGIAVRSQRAVVAAAHERARVADATREEEAQRRVAEERLRIARELHDVIAHHVAVINVQAGVAGHLVRTDPDGADRAIAHVREASQTVLAEVRGCSVCCAPQETPARTSSRPGRLHASPTPRSSSSRHAAPAWGSPGGSPASRLSSHLPTI